MEVKVDKIILLRVEKKKLKLVKERMMDGERDKRLLKLLAVLKAW